MVRGRVTTKPDQKSLQECLRRILSDASGNHSGFQSIGSEAQKTSSAPSRADGEFVTFWVGENIIGHSGPTIIRKDFNRNTVYEDSYA